MNVKVNQSDGNEIHSNGNINNSDGKENHSNVKENHSDDNKNTLNRKENNSAGKEIKSILIPKSTPNSPIYSLRITILAIKASFLKTLNRKKPPPAFNGHSTQKNLIRTKTIKELVRTFGVELKVINPLNYLMSFKIDDKNYSEYKKIFEIFWRHQSKYFTPEIIKDNSPIDVLNGFEKKSKLIAKRGLKEGLRDMISQLKHYPLDLVKNIEADLAKNNLPSTQVLFDRFTNTTAKVLKRGKIKNLDEFYTIKELVVDLTSNLSESDRNTLDKYLVEFEFCSKKQANNIK